MPNSVSIDAMQSRAIAAEIGERLRSLMGAEREIPFPEISAVRIIVLNRYRG